MSKPRIVYFVQDTVTTDDGQYIPCIAVEGESGYHKTNWAWGSDYDIASKLCNARNGRQGISPKEANKIIIGTMSDPRRDNFGIKIK